MVIGILLCTGMFLSAYLSSFLAKKFRGVNYVVLTIVAIVLISFFSAFGWIEVTQRVYIQGTFWHVRPVFPLPLSFPFFTYVHDVRGEVYDFLFLGKLIKREYSEWFSSGAAIMYYSFFLLVNIIGSIIGYWAPKKGFARHKFKKRRVDPEENKGRDLL